MGVKQWIAKQGIKAGNRISKLSALSPAQMEQIIDLRDQYFGDMAEHNPGHNSERLTRGLLASSSIEIFNAYLPQLQELYTPVDKTASLRIVKSNGEELAEHFPEFDKDHNIRFINISKWVTDKQENSLEKLVNVYAVLSNERCNIALIFHRTKTETQVYLAVVNTQNAGDNSDADEYIKRLTDAVRGNFPGSVFSAKPAMGSPKCLANMDKKSVAIASNIPTEKSEKFISQTIEKLLDGIIPESIKEEYTLILLATPVRDVETRKLRLSELYTGLAPYSEWQTNFTYTETMAEGSSATLGVNVGASAGIQNGQNQSIQNSIAKQNSEGNQFGRQEGKQQNQANAQMQQKTNGENVTDGTSSASTYTTTEGEVYNATHTDSSSITDTLGGSVSAAVNQTISAGLTETATVASVGFGGSVSAQQSTSTGVHLGTSIDQHHATGSSIADAISKGTNNSVSNATMNGINHTLTQIASQTIGKTVTETIGSSTSTSIAQTLGRAVTNTLGKTAGVFSSFNLGGNIGTSFARSSNITATIGKGEGITQNFTNHTVKHALELLEQQMARFEQSTALGMWDFAAYVISEDINVANNVAHSYLALTEGESSFLSHSAVNVWRGDIEDNGAAKMICEYLQELRHPEFVIDPCILEADLGFFAYPPYVTATTVLSGKELAYSLNFPSKSISGLSIYECAEFGRNIATHNVMEEDVAKIKLGKIFHMNHEEKLRVHLQCKSLTSHTFITGSTGSGKSNTVYQILSEAHKHSIPFLVIEPAKGEYKNVFCDYGNISIYGTNPKKTSLLRINPFSFPDDVHVLEHIDRLVEIFNVCWPMYAAMPAVLKNAIEKSYEDCGWDLTESENVYGDNLYPQFYDVARNVKLIIDSSEYDTENKGAYKGSLLTRLNSLTNGINGLIFTDDELSMENLFDENVIVDLSRVGSSETKSLIMGMLVLKLQEYRMTQGEMNAPLKHITVLEEAHNLLKRTSTEQVSESANLIGKSVEMISNAIAEMRTYGEGFIIADQSPGLLDMAAIRNTNTKIIMRLPDITDRELVGQAANLNDNQITELAKLPCGVAAVYQNEWIQPVLCKVEKYDTVEEKYDYQRNKTIKSEVNSNDMIDIAHMLSNGIGMNRETILKEIIPLLQKNNIKASVQVAIAKQLENPPKVPRPTKLASIMSSLFPKVKRAIVSAYRDTSDVSEWTTQAVSSLHECVKSELDNITRNRIIQSIITEHIYFECNKIEDVKKWSEKGGLL
ncbi:MAG: DUF87 domain-containing protein [Ruminococcus sp.]|nr:DUF87 domain-containing protein [Ruminococcus sp.]